MIPQKDQILEWAENPVTLYLKSLVEKEMEFFEKIGTPDTFFEFEPHKTQEAMVKNMAFIGAYEDLRRALEGDFSEFSSEDESEPE